MLDLTLSLVITLFNTSCFIQIHIRPAREGPSKGVPGDRAGGGPVPILLAGGRGVEAVRERTVLPLGSQNQ